jgi:hypothetical protein
VQNELQDVSIRSSQHLIEETATDYGAALVYMSFAKNLGSLAHDMRLIEIGATDAGTVREYLSQQRSVTPANIDDTAP